MTYVEWLRVRNALKGTAITLGIIFLLAIALRVAAAQFVPDQAMINGLSAEPGTTTVSSVLPDGTKRKVLDNAAKRTHIVVDVHPNGSSDVTITKPAKAGQGAAAGDDAVRLRSTSRTLDFGKGGDAPIDDFFEVGALVALIAATILAVPFARENDGHLNLVWTKPIGRERLAFAMIGVDVVGIIGAYALGIVAAMAIAALFGFPHLIVASHSWGKLAGDLLVAVAWYAFINAASASLRRGYGAVLGFAWPVALIIAALSQVNFGGSALGATLQSVIWAISRIDPLTYADFKSSGVSSDAAYFPLIAFLVIVYAASAIVQWRRVEA